GYMGAGKTTTARRLAQRMGWEVVDACKLGIFSFLKLNMYEDLRRNADRILKNENIRALLGEAEEQPVHSAEETATSKMFETNAGYPETARSLNDRQRRTERSEAFDQNPAADDKPKASNPLIDLHTVVDADSSQIEAILMAKSGKSFVLQGPPGTGKSQTITNIIAECLHDGKKVLFVSEKQAALNVVFDKLKKAGLADFCLELHSHKANKRAVIDELCRTMETPKSSVSSDADEEIRQKANAQAQLDGYAFALHQKRENIEKSLYELFELYAGERNTPETAFVIEDIEKKGKEYFQAAVRALEQYAEYIPSVGKNYRENPWFGFADERISFAGRAQMKTDLAELSDGFGRLREESALHQEKYRTLAMNQAAAKSWQEFLEFCGQSDVITPALLFGRTLEETLPQIWRLRDLAGELVPLRDRFLEKFNPSALGGLDGKTLYGRFIGEFGSFFSRMFSGDYRSLIASLQLHSKTGEKPSYERAVKYAEQLMKVQELQTAFDQAARPVQNLFGKCWQGPDTDWDHVLLEIQKLQKCHAERSASHLERIACHSERSEESPRNAYPEKTSQTVE
ncbi:MAG: AAA domain-containing protein, partial [bacterium]